MIAKPSFDAEATAKSFHTAFKGKTLNKNTKSVLNFYFYLNAKYLIKRSGH